jgi:OOP family OmpA-OmpF porin
MVTMRATLTVTAALAVVLAQSVSVPGYADDVPNSQQLIQSLSITNSTRGIHIGKQIAPPPPVTPASTGSAPAAVTTTTPPTTATPDPASVSTMTAPPVLPPTNAPPASSAAVTPPVTNAPVTNAPVTNAPNSGEANLTVPFASGSSIISPDAARVLDQLGEALRSPQLQGQRFRVEGHTDTAGQPDMNRALSERRAQSVSEYLETRFHIDRSRLTPVGMGEEGLLIATGPGVSNAANRRVLVVNLGP